MAFTAYFPIIRATIENPVLGRLQQVRNAVGLLHATWSPAAYQVDIGMEPFRQPDWNRFTSDVLLSLRRPSEWVVPGAHPVSRLQTSQAAIEETPLRCTRTVRATRRNAGPSAH